MPGHVEVAGPPTRVRWAGRLRFDRKGREGKRRGHNGVNTLQETLHAAIPLLANLGGLKIVSRAEEGTRRDLLPGATTVVPSALAQAFGVLRERLHPVEERPDELQVTGALERDLLQTDAESLELVEGGPHRSVHIRVKTFIKMLPRKTDHEALDGFLHLRRERWNGATRRGSVQRVVT